VISIRVYETDGMVTRIRVTGHATGKMGERICCAISALSRMLLRTVGAEWREDSPHLKYGEFDYSKFTKKHQVKIGIVIQGYSIYTELAPEHVKMLRVIQRGK
jgi:uncharacterized protein YsxB (DUF464 family)